jgi:hypothetical protein
MPALLYEFVLTFYHTFFTATSVDVKCLFSKGHLHLSHVRSRLMAQSTRALLCLGYWNRLNLVKMEDIVKISSLPDVEDVKSRQRYSQRLSSW